MADFQSISNRKIVLPNWLDDLIYNKMSAQYSKKNKDLVVLDWCRNDILYYLETYFPRSYAESYCIFSTYFNDNKLRYEDIEELTVFDFGCGTGGELIGFLVAVSENLLNVKNIGIRALDGTLANVRG